MDELVPRQQKRVAVPLTIQLESASGNNEARITDLSLGGCYVDSIFGVQPGRSVNFNLALPSGRSGKMSGTIVYVHEGIGFGLQFNDLTSEQRTMLEQLILVCGGSV